MRSLFEYSPLLLDSFNFSHEIYSNYGNVEWTACIIDGLITLILDPIIDWNRYLAIMEMSLILIQKKGIFQREEEEEELAIESIHDTPFSLYSHTLFFFRDRYIVY